MSANRDSSQKISFVYTNLHHLYTKGRKAAQSAELKGVETARVLKTESLSTPFAVPGKAEKTPEKVTPLREVRDLAAHTEQEQALKGLRRNLDELKSIQSRLRFLMSEIDEFTRK